MKKVLIRGMKKMGGVGKKIAEESPNTMYAFLYYEPKAPKALKK